MSSVVSARVAHDIHVNQLVDLDDIAKLRDVWCRLHSRTPTAGFFQTWEWLDCLWRWQSDRISPRVYVVRREDQIIGIVPLSLLSETTRLGKVNMLGFPLEDWGSSFNCVSPESSLVWQALLSDLASARRDWSVLDLRWVAPDQIDALAGAAEAAAISYTIQPWQRCYVVDCQCGWETYWSELKGKLRNSLRRYQKKLESQGELTFERYRPAGWRDTETDPRWDLYDEIMQVSEASWQHAAEDGNTMSDDRVADFLQEAHQLAVIAGMVDLSVLRLNDQPIAYTYNYVSDGRVDALRFGFDPAFRSLGPGSVMIKMFLEDSFRRGDRVVNLGARDYGYKHRWANEQYCTSRLTHYTATNMRAQMLRLKRQFDNHVPDEA